MGGIIMSAFRYRGPLSPTDPLFQGRQSELHQLNRWCLGEVQNYGIAYGGRQNGKTSLLYHFEANLPNGVLGCRVDFQNLPGGDSAQSYTYLARQVSQVLGFSLSTPPTDAPSLTECLCDGMAQTNARLVVLLLEELGALSELARHNLANTLRAIFTNRYGKTCRPLARLLVVLSGSIELYNLASHQVSPLNNICEKFYLANLSQPDAENLVLTALDELNVSDSQAMALASSVYARVQGHPYLTQRLGAFLEEASLGGLPLTEALLDEGEAAILSDDPLMLHLHGALEEYQLMDAVGELLSGQRRFSRQSEDLARLELLGLAHPQDGRWVVRNRLLHRVLELWTKPVSIPVKQIPSSQKEPPMPVVLIATVTKTESQAVLKTFSGATSRPWERKPIGDKTYFAFGQVGGADVLMVQSEMGSATPGGALLTIHNAIEDLHPVAVIMVGIGFGTKPDKQQMGDILVSRQLMDYEPGKVRSKNKFTPRGDRVTCSVALLDKFRTADFDWTGPSVHFGLILTGEKLVNDEGFRARLLKIEPEAIGGEMEGAGLYVAAQSARVDWILVKGICDWADSHKADNAQFQAAQNAAEFVLHTLKMTEWVESNHNHPTTASSETINHLATLNGAGAISQGNNNVTVGAGGIYVAGNANGNLTVGDGNQSIKDSYNKISAAKIDAELKQTLKQLADAVAVMTQSLPAEQSTEVTEDLSKLVEEATKPKPNKRWYSVSIDGLIKAAENLDKLGTPVISLSRKVLSLLTAGVIK